MKAQQNIEDIFREKLSKLEADPGANAWANVKSGLEGAAAGSASAGSAKVAAASSTSWVSTIVVGSLIAVTAAGGYFFFDKQGEKQKIKTEQQQKEVQVNIPAEEEPVQETLVEENNPVTEEKVAVETPEKQTEKPEVKQRKEIAPKVTTARSTENTRKTDQEKTIDEIIAESQAQLEANKKAAEALERAMKDSDSENNTSVNKLDETKVGGVTEKNIEDSVEGSEKSNTTEDLAETIQFPNVFSPNLDGKNDVFKLKDEYSQQLDNLEIYIYSSSGKVIKQWVGLSDSWDGTYKDGSLAPQGNYFYYAVLRKDNKEYPKKGKFNLIR